MSKVSFNGIKLPIKEESKMKVSQPKREWIKEEDWDWKCPMCGSEDWDTRDYDYDIGVGGGIGQKVCCDQCDAEFTIYYNTTLAGVSLVVGREEVDWPPHLDE
jgi:hypothetical protein